MGHAEKACTLSRQLCYCGGPPLSFTMGIKPDDDLLKSVRFILEKHGDQAIEHFMVESRPEYCRVEAPARMLERCCQSCGKLLCPEAPLQSPRAIANSQQALRRPLQGPVFFPPMRRHPSAAKDQ